MRDMFIRSIDNWYTCRMIVNWRNEKEIEHMNPIEHMFQGEHLIFLSGLRNNNKFVATWSYIRWEVKSIQNLSSFTDDIGIPVTICITSPSCNSSTILDSKVFCDSLRISLMVLSLSLWKVNVGRFSGSCWEHTSQHKCEGKRWWFHSHHIIQSTFPNCERAMQTRYFLVWYDERLVFPPKRIWFSGLEELWLFWNWPRA